MKWNPFWNPLKPCIGNVFLLLHTTELYKPGVINCLHHLHHLDSIKESYYTIPRCLSYDSVEGHRDEMRVHQWHMTDREWVEAFRWYRWVTGSHSQGINYCQVQIENNTPKYHHSEFFIYRSSWLRARFTKYGKLVCSRNLIKPLMGVESSVGDLLRMRKFSVRHKICVFE